MTIYVYVCVRTRALTCVCNENNIIVKRMIIGCMINKISEKLLKGLVKKYANNCRKKMLTSNSLTMMSEHQIPLLLFNRLTFPNISG